MAMLHIAEVLIVINKVVLTFFLQRLKTSLAVLLFFLIMFWCEQLDVCASDYVQRYLLTFLNPLSF